MKRYFLAIIVLSVFIMFLINYFLKEIKSKKYKNSIEHFNGHLDPSIDHILPKEKIIENCRKNFERNDRRINCHNEAFVTDPGLLCGISDKMNVITTKLDQYYGIVGKNFNGLQWNLRNLNPKDYNNIPIIPSLMKNISCLLGSYTSSMYFMIYSNTSVTIQIHSKNYAVNPNKLNVIFIPNVSSKDLLLIDVEGGSGNNLLSFSYLWNQQLFIMDENGFNSSLNKISYEKSSGKNQWSMLNISNIPSYMMNGMVIPKTGETVKIKIGETKNLLMGAKSLVLELVTFGDLDISINDKNVYSTKEKNKLITVEIPEVRLGDQLNMDIKNLPSSNNPILGFSYIYNGNVFIYPYIGQYSMMNSLTHRMFITSKSWDGSFSPLNVPNLPLTLYSGISNKTNNKNMSITTNIGTDSNDLVVMIVSNIDCKISCGKETYSYTNLKTVVYYLFHNVQEEDSLKISFTDNKSKSGLSVSYLWKGDLYTLSEANSMCDESFLSDKSKEIKASKFYNRISFTEKNGFSSETSSEWSNGINGLPIFMNQWLIIHKETRNGHLLWKVGKKEMNGFIDKNLLLLFMELNGNTNILIDGKEIVSNFNNKTLKSLLLPISKNSEIVFQGKSNNNSCLNISYIYDGKLHLLANNGSFLNSSKILSYYVGNDIISSGCNASYSSPNLPIYMSNKSYINIPSGNSFEIYTYIL